MDPVLAIDFGTSNSAAAVLMPDESVLVLIDSTTPHTHATLGRGKAFPTWLQYDDAGNVVAAGAAAKAQADKLPGRVVHSLKPLLGRTWLEAEATGALARLQVGVQPDAETGLCLLEIGEHSIRPQEACAALLRHIADQARVATGIEFDDVVLSVPAHHANKQLAVMQESARLAGFKGRIDIVREPVAAALSMNVPITPRPVRSLVFDLGGGTLDISAAELCRTAPGPTGLQCQSLGYTGDNDLGGLSFDDRLCDHLQHVFDLPPLGEVDRARLRQAAETAKIRLSDAESVEVVYDWGAQALRHTLTRAAFEAALRGGNRDLLAAIADQLRAVLVMARWQPEDVDLLALVGGPTKTACVLQVVREVFYRNATVLWQIDAAEAVDPMTAVAVGAAKFRAAETVSRHPFGYGYVAVTATPTGKEGTLRITREPVILIPCNTVYPSPLRTEIAQVAQYRGDKVVGIEIIQRMPDADPGTAEMGPYRFIGLRHLAVDDDRFGVEVMISTRLNENGEFELTLTNLFDGRCISYIGTGTTRRHAIELPSSTLERHLPRHGEWVFVPDFAGGVRQWAEALHARLRDAPRRHEADRHLAQSLQALASAIAAVPRLVCAERQANDLYLAGRSVLARAQELLLIDEPGAASLEAELEAARRACYRYDEAALDTAEA